MGFPLFGLINEFCNFTSKDFMTTTRLCCGDLEGNGVEPLIVTGAVALKECLDLVGSGHGIGGASGYSLGCDSEAKMVGSCGKNFIRCEHKI